MGHNTDVERHTNLLIKKLLVMHSHGLGVEQICRYLERMPCALVSIKASETLLTAGAAALQAQDLKTSYHCYALAIIMRYASIHGCFTMAEACISSISPPHLVEMTEALAESADKHGDPCKEKLHCALKKRLSPDAYNSALTVATSNVSSPATRHAAGGSVSRMHIAQQRSNRPAGLYDYAEREQIHEAHLRPEYIRHAQMLTDQLEAESMQVRSYTG